MVESFSRSRRDAQAEDEGAFKATDAIAITGVTRTPVVLDAVGNSLAGAIPARDTRAQEIAARTAIDPESCPEAAHYDAFHPAARLKWISQQTPQAIVHASAVVDPKDFIASRLTGRIASDPISQARLVAAASTIDGPSLLSRLGLPEISCPTCCRPASVIDRVRTTERAVQCARRKAGRDGVARHLVRRGRARRTVPGRAYNVSGTTETFGVMTTQAFRPAA